MAYPHAAGRRLRNHRLLKQPVPPDSSATLAIGSLACSLARAGCHGLAVLAGWAQGAAVRETVNFTWIQVERPGCGPGWILDPLSAVMLVMVCFVGLLISTVRPATWLTTKTLPASSAFLVCLRAHARVVIANSVLLLFMCWSCWTPTSYLLIGFWYHKPSAAAAAKVFLTTRVGDVFFCWHRMALCADRQSAVLQRRCRLD